MARTVSTSSDLVGGRTEGGMLGLWACQPWSPQLPRRHALSASAIPSVSQARRLDSQPQRSAAPVAARYVRALGHWRTALAMEAEAAGVCV